jgi:hypothetical protein
MTISEFLLTEETIEHASNPEYYTEPKIIVGLIIFFFAMAGIIWSHYRREDEIWAGMKGADKLLQTPEYIVYIWIKLYPVVILADLLLDFELSNNGWWSMNIIMLLALVGKVAVMRYLKIKDEKEVESKLKSEEP